MLIFAYTSTRTDEISIQSIEGMLREQDGVHSIKVALLAERAVIEYDPAVWNSDKLINVSTGSVSYFLNGTDLHIGNI